MSGAHGGCGVCVGRGRLGVCGSAVVLPLWRLGEFGDVVFENTAKAWRSRVPVREFCMMKFTYFVCVYNFINVNYVGPM